MFQRQNTEEDRNDTGSEKENPAKLSGKGDEDGLEEEEEERAQTPPPRRGRRGTGCFVAEDGSEENTPKSAPVAKKVSDKKAVRKGPTVASSTSSPIVSPQSSTKKEPVVASLSKKKAQVAANEEKKEPRTRMLVTEKTEESLDKKAEEDSFRPGMQRPRTGKSFQRNASRKGTADLTKLASEKKKKVVMCEEAIVEEIDIAVDKVSAISMNRMLFSGVRHSLAASRTAGRPKLRLKDVVDLVRFHWRRLNVGRFFIVEMDKSVVESKKKQEEQAAADKLQEIIMAHLELAFSELCGDPLAELLTIVQPLTEAMENWKLAHQGLNHDDGSHSSRVINSVAGISIAVITSEERRVALGEVLNDMFLLSNRLHDPITNSSVYVADDVSEFKESVELGQSVLGNFASEILKLSELLQQLLKFDDARHDDEAQQNPLLSIVKAGNCKDSITDITDSHLRKQLLLSKLAAWDPADKVREQINAMVNGIPANLLDKPWLIKLGFMEPPKANMQTLLKAKAAWRNSARTTSKSNQKKPGAQGSQRQGTNEEAIPDGFGGLMVGNSNKNVTSAMPHGRGSLLSALSARSNGTRRTSHLAGVRRSSTLEGSHLPVGAISGLSGTNSVNGLPPSRTRGSFRSCDSNDIDSPIAARGIVKSARDSFLAPRAPELAEAPVPKTEETELPEVPKTEDSDDENSEGSEECEMDRTVSSKLVRACMRSSLRKKTQSPAPMDDGKQPMADVAAGLLAGEVERRLSTGRLLALTAQKLGWEKKEVLATTPLAKRGDQFSNEAFDEAGTSRSPQMGADDGEFSDGSDLVSELADLDGLPPPVIRKLTSREGQRSPNYIGKGPLLFDFFAPRGSPSNCTSHMSSRPPTRCQEPRLLTAERAGRTRSPGADSQVALHVVRQKFRALPKLRELLVSTADAILGEAILDNVWGIGLSFEDPLIRDPSQWRGRNVLGTALVRLRDELRQIAASSSRPAPIDGAFQRNAVSTDVWSSPPPPPPPPQQPDERNTTLLCMQHSSTPSVLPVANVSKPPPPPFALPYAPPASANHRNVPDVIRQKSSRAGHTTVPADASGGMRTTLVRRADIAEDVSPILASCNTIMKATRPGATDWRQEDDESCVAQ